MFHSSFHNRDRLTVARRFCILSIAFLLIGQTLASSPLVTSKYSSTTSLPFMINILALGILFGLLMYTLLLAIFTKERMFIYFAIIMILLTILQTFATYETFIFQLTYNRVTLITHLLFITFLLFFEDLFALSNHEKKLSKINKISIYVIALFTLFFLIMKTLILESSHFSSLLNFIRELFVFYTNILFIYTIIKAMKWMKKEAILLLIAFIPPALLTSINAMNIFPFMHNAEKVVQFMMQYNQPIGLSLQAILFSLAIGNRYNTVRLERQESILENNRIAQLDTEKTNFFMDMNHELRNPITIILGTTQQLRKGKFGDSISHNDHLLQTIERNSIRLLKQTSHILRLGKPQSQVSLDRFLVATFLSSIVNELMAISLEKNITLTCIIDKTVDDVVLSMALVDFETVVNNLISNALKFSPSGASICVEATIKASGDLTIIVRDTGIGISDERQKLIFDRYNSRQGDHLYLQTGLGLTLVKSIMEGYLGDVALQSTEGIGSSFTLTFPSHMISHHFSHDNVIRNKESIITNIYKHELMFDEHNRTLIDATYPEDTEHTIMVVEDNDDMRTYITSVLMEKYNVISVSSATQALEELKKMDVHIIVSDIMMEEMDGHAFLQALKQLPLEEPIPLIFLTARDCEEEKIKSLKEGAIRYLTKPFSPEMLLAIIENSIQHDTLLIHSKMQKIKKEVDTILERDNSSRGKNKTYSDSDLLNQFISFTGFSKREQQVFSLIIAGKSDKEIAILLDLSVKTIANHNQRIYHKANVNSRYELLSKVYALR